MKQTLRCEEIIQNLGISSAKFEEWKNKINTETGSQQPTAHSLTLQHSNKHDDSSNLPCTLPQDSDHN
jgi:transposase